MEEEIESKILNLHSQKYSEEEISEMLNLHLGIVITYIIELREKGLIPYKTFKNRHKYSSKERQIQISDMVNQGFSLNEIIEFTHFSTGTISAYILKACKNGLIKNKESMHSIKEAIKISKKIIHVMPDSSQTDVHSKSILLEEFFKNHPDIFSANQVPKHIDIDKIADVVKNLGYQKDDVNLLVRIYVNSGLYEEAVNLLYSYEKNNELSNKEKRIIEQAKHNLRMFEAKQFFRDVPKTLSSDSYDERL